MRARRWLIAVCGLLPLGLSSLHCCRFAIDLPGPGVRVLPGGFLVRPYLQLGDDPTAAGAGGLRVLWQTEDLDAAWVLEYSTRAGGRLAAGRCRRAGAGSPCRGIPRAPGLPGDARPAWSRAARSRTGCVAGVRSSSRPEARAPKAAGQPYRFAVFGDCGAGTAEQKAVAYQTYQARPDFLLIAGDIVYTRGRISEYREKFWPVYNADVASPAAGAPLLRSTLFVAAPGNHDIAARDLGKYPDGLAYFCYWDQPLNGPIGQEGGRSVPLLYGPEANRTAFLQAAGPAYPRMANFSFDYGNAHWTVLDSNPYVDWTDPDLRAWVERDLAAAKDATWRFVAFHHPPFNSSQGPLRRPADARAGRRLRGGQGRRRLDRARPQLPAHVPAHLPPSIRGADGKPVRQRGPDPRPLDARQVLRRPHRHPAPRRHLRDHRRRRREPLQPRAARRPRHPGSRSPTSSSRGSTP